MKMEDKWLDLRLTKQTMDHLWNDISEENKDDHSAELAGNISKSETIIDKDNWFYETVLKKLTERMFYDDWNNYRKYVVGKNEDEKPKFEMKSFWVNYQKQHEFNPLHDHTGLYSFVVFMKIPTHWKEQHALPISANSTAPIASDFAFVWSEKKGETCETRYFPLSSEDEGRVLFFPAHLQHMVYPFYECEEERITISGNIMLKSSDKPKIQFSSDVYEDKEKIIEILETSLKVTKQELEMMKKRGKAKKNKVIKN